MGQPGPASGRDRLRLLLFAGILFAGAWLVSGCDDSSTVVFTVTTTSDIGRDANPGDGLCEVTPGAGNCSLRAAVDEANVTLGDISLPQGTYRLTRAGAEDDNNGGDLDLAPPGQILTITGGGTGAVIDTNGADGGIDVRGGIVALRGVAVREAAGAGVASRYGSGLILDRVSIHSNPGTGLDIDYGGAVLGLDLTVADNDGTGVTTDGVFEARFTTVTANGGGGVTGGGQSRLTASIVADQTAGDDCTSTTELSFGYNLDSDGTCGLTATGDQPNTPAQLAALSTDTLPAHFPQPDSPAKNAVPVLDPNCASNPDDQMAQPRPHGGACDRGAIEDRGIALVVDDPADETDTNPGDGTCHTPGGGCTLRAAIDETNTIAHTGANHIALQTDVELTIATDEDYGNEAGDLDITTSVYLDGNGHTIDANGVDRALDHHFGRFTLTATTVTGGDPLEDGSGNEQSGAGIRAQGERFHLRDSLVVGNTNEDSGADGGGGIYVGTIRRASITGTTIADNQTTYWGGGILSEGLLTVSNSTISGNSAMDGAGLYVAFGQADLRSSSVVANAGESSIAGHFTLVVSGSVLDGGGDPVCEETVDSGGHNLVGDATCGLDGPGDQQDRAALLSALGDNGGPTPTFLPYQNSPAIDAIPAGTPGLCDGTSAVDQRGQPRPEGAACDVGAVEGHTGTAIAPLALVVDDPTDAPDDTPGDGICDAIGGACTLRAAIDEANAWPAADTIELTVDTTLTRVGPIEDQNATGDLDIWGHLTIDGNGHTIDAHQLDRVVHHNGGTLDLLDLVVTGGLAPDEYPGPTGGGIRTEASLHVVGTTVAGNAVVAEGRGGGVHVDGIATITNSTISDNQADYGSGLYSSNWDPWLYATGLTSVAMSTVVDNEGPTALAGDGITLAGSIVDASSAACEDHPTSGGFNVASDGTCALDAAGDQEGAAPLLGPLGANGGPTPTHLPFQNSPAVDAIPAGTPGLCDGTIATDQRGLPRPDGPACDAGAVEGHSGFPALPLDLVVDDPTDARDHTPGDGACEKVGGGCTLRAAIDEANAWPAAATIDLTVDPTLSLAGQGEDGNATGDLDIENHLTLDGNGHTIDGNQLDRVLHHLAGALTVVDTTVTGGRLTSTSGEGGGVRSTGHLNLDGVTVSGNALTGSTSRGAGLHLTSSIAQIHETTISDNTLAGGFGLGAGLYHEGSSLTISRSSIIDNVATGGTDRGGGAYLFSPATIDQSTVAGNRLTGSSSDGGGVYTRTGLVVTATTFSANEAGRSGGAIFAFLAPPTVADSTLTGNRAATVTTSGTGAAISAGGGTGSIRRSTITANVGPSAVTGSFTVGGSVVDAGDLVACSGPLTSVGYNLASDTTCALAGTGDVQDTDPLLAMLADNGGPTPTHLPFQNSLAVDAIPPGTPVLCDGTSAVDQRGESRPAGPACDIGAVEGDTGIDLLPLTLVVDDPADEPDLAPGDALCTTAGGGCTLRAAIDETNVWPTDDSIEIAPGTTPTLATSGTGEDLNQTGDLDVLDGLVLDGNGQTVDANQVDRALHHRVGDLALVDVTITDGRLTTSSAEGAGIWSTGRITLDRVEVTGNQTTLGGGEGAGVYLDGGGGQLLGSSITDNLLGVTSGRGAGVHLRAGSLVVSDSTIAANHVGISGERGGGIYAGPHTTVTITASTIADNLVGTGSGAGIYADSGSTVTISDSSVTGNAGRTGGGLYLAGSAAIDGSTFSGNVASVDGGAIYRSSSTSTSLALDNSTLSGNSAPSGAAIYQTSATGAPSIDYTTIAGNIGATSIRGWLTSRASIIESATSACSTALTSSGWNVGSDTTCGLNQPTDAVGPALLGPLADNGGATQTQAPFGGSPAVDRIPTGTPLLCDGTFDVDQRDEVRPTGPGCDAGAVEGDFGIATPLDLTVDSPADAPDVAPGDGACATASATCTLRAAIDEANAYPTADAVTVSPGVNPVLTIAGADENGNATGDLDIAGDLVLDATGSTIDADALDRVLDHHLGELTVVGGTYRDGFVDDDNGAGMRSGGLAVTVSAATFESNHASEDGRGGGLYLSTPDSVVEDSTIADNSAGENGGGIAIIGGTITGTIMSGNHSTFYGGGVYVDETVAITGSSVTGNSTDTLGAGIYGEDADLTIGDTSVSGNHSDSAGGGIATDGGNLEIEQSTIAANTGGVAAGLHLEGPYHIADSTISGNTANDGSAIESDTVGTISNTTVTENIAFSSSGKTIRNFGQMTVVHATIVGNVAQHTVDSSEPFTLQASVVGSGSVAACTFPVTSGGWNVVSDSSCDLAQPGDVQGAQPLLGPLADNGGPTLTHLPQVGSPLREAIPAGTPGLCDGTIPTDQRGVARPQGGACDIGAVEQ